ncbi:hypothetical protein, partial [Nocardia cyriacigeorgica]|uniref:hypothetical protein n=1 Tax=Nocardia cyriacigeorgica TaxID=135487 RepID=UPI001E5120DD
MTEKFGHFLVPDPLPEADRMNRPPGPHDSMHARRTEHRPSRSGEWGYIGHATTIRSGTDNTGGEFGQLSLGNDLSSVRSATQPDLTGNT